MTETLLTAILNVQQGAPSISKDTNNPFFKSKYADLPTIWQTIKDLMGENKLIVTNCMDSKDGSDYIITKIIHTPTGESIESISKVMLAKATAQEYGSYITYMRRYALSAMLGLVTDEDDDGNAASKQKKEEKPVDNYPNQFFDTFFDMKNWALDFKKAIEGCMTLDALQTIWTKEHNQNCVKALDEYHMKLVNKAKDDKKKELSA